jgi:hypothetical protein
VKFLSGIIFLLTVSVFSYGDNDTIRFEQAGFSINPLDQKASSAGSQPITMMLPAVNGFSANVNVQIQPYPGTLEEYEDLSKSQFKQLGLKTISTSRTKTMLVLEYSGIMQGRHLHFYAKAAKVGELFYLATATDLESEWVSNSNKLKSVIDSFNVNL